MLFIAKNSLINFLFPIFVVTFSIDKNTRPTSRMAYKSLIKAII